MIPTCYTVNISSQIAQTLTDFFFVDLAFLHCNTDGSLNYNNGPLSPGNDPDMQAGVQLLNDNSSFVLFSIGGSGGDDFQNIGNNYQTFLDNLLAVLQSYGVSGIDIDYEEAQTPQIQDTIQQLITDVSNAGYLVTAVPPGGPGFWPSIVQNTMQSNGFPQLFFCNLQLYGGAVFSQWVQAFTGVVPDPQAFLGSGYLSGQLTPQQVGTQLQSLLGQDPQTISAFIWRSPLVTGSGTTMAEYAQAIIDAGSPCSKAAVANRVAEHRARVQKKTA